MICPAALYSVRLMKKEVFGPVESRASDAHISIAFSGHALSWINVLCLTGWAAMLNGANSTNVA